MAEQSRLQIVDSDVRDLIHAALSAAFGSSIVTAVEPVAGGASGAATFRADVAGRSYFLRIERQRSPFRNPHQYVCMQIAADAGIAPPIRYLDADAGVLILDYLPSQSLTHYPGGTAHLVRDLGALLTRLQQTPAFPELRDYPVVVERLLGFVRQRLFVPGLLDAHADGFERIKEAYPWNAAARVSSHNDPNPRNILFDGDRLWLIDWETAYRNDPWVDAAIVADSFAPTPDLEDVLLQSWLGVSPDAMMRARLLLMRQVTRLYYAGLLLGLAAAGGPRTPERDLSAPVETEFRRSVASGDLAAGAPDTMLLLGKMQLARFLTGLHDPGFDRALAIVRQG